MTELERTWNERRLRIEELEAENKELKNKLEEELEFEKERNKVLEEELLIKRKQLINAGFYLNRAKDVLCKLETGMRHIADNHPTMYAHKEIMQNLSLAEDYTKELGEICSQGNFGLDEIMESMNESNKQN